MIGWDVILGGVTGLLGNFITSIMNYKTMTANNSHEAKMTALKTAAMKAEARMKMEITKTEYQGKVDLADAASFEKGLEVGNKQLFSEKWVDRLFSVEGWMKFLSIPAGIIVAVLFGMVDWLRGFMRPALTIYLTGMATFITWKAYELINIAGTGHLTITEAVSLYGRTTDIIIYLTTTCITWWFGDRRSAKFIAKMYGDGKD